MLKKLAFLIAILASASFAQDCGQRSTLTAVGAGSSIDNRSNGCQLWTLTYWVDGFTALSVQLEYSTNNTTWTATSLVLTDVPVGVGKVTFFGPRMRLNLTAVTGTGTFFYNLNGYKGDYKFVAGATGGGAGTPGFGITITGDVVAVKTTEVLSRATDQAGTDTSCVSSDASGTTYTCDLTPALGALANQMLIIWTRTQSCTAGAITLNISTLGPISIKLADGTTNPAAGDCTADQRVILTYDGTVFRIIGGGAAGSGTTYTAGNGINIASNVISQSTAFATGSGYWAPFNLSYANGTIQLDATANKVYAFEMTPHINLSVGKVLGFQITDSAGKHFAFGICDAACTTMVATSATVTSATNATFSPTLTATLVAGATYNLLITSDQVAAQITMLSVSGGTSLYLVLNADASNPRAFSCANLSTGTTTLVFPSTCGARTALSSKDPPMILLAK
jgi:hypothetical protein